MFYSIPNLRASTVTLVPEPWALETETPPDYSAGKAAVIEFSNQFTTKHAFLSMVEGTTAEVRVTMNDNPPYRLHGIMADYDAPLPESPVDHILQKQQSEFLPTYLVTTAQEQARLIWEFEEPLLWTNKNHMKAFILLLSKHLRLNRWLAGLETQALTNWVKYYDLGKEWAEVDAAARIPKALTSLWFFQAAEKQRFDTSKNMSYKIPMEDLAAEVESRYPGRWRGRFDLGARGLRFWAPEADNETAAVVTEEGMLCYTGGQPFLTWKQLFGSAFVERYEAESMSDIVDNTVYDGQSFYIQVEPNEWKAFSKPDFTQELRVQGKDSTRPRGETCSEVDKIENFIKRNRDVKAALPFLFFPSGVIRHDGQRFLNTSNLRPINPAPPETEPPMPFSEGRTKFPLIYKVLRNMFLQEEGKDDDQLTYMLAWLKYAYVNALNQTPRPGHCVILAGPPGKGKTFLSWQIISGLMGGRADAASHLVDNDSWTERIIQKPVMTIDDSSALTDEKSRRAFTNRVKRYTSNAEMLYNQKYEKTGGVPWFGRIVITCNLDAESLLILPDMDVSTQDKICLFKTSDAKIPFKDWDTNNAAARKELPHFARFLVEWTPPEDVMPPDKRFGIEAYHNSDLFEAARRHGIGEMLEQVGLFMDEYFQLHPEREHWEGVTTQLIADLSAKFPACRSFTYQGLNSQLGKAAAANYRIIKIQDKDSAATRWRIYRNLFQKFRPEDRL